MKIHSGISVLAVIGMFMAPLTSVNGSIPRSQPDIKKDRGTKQTIS